MERYRKFFKEFYPRICQDILPRKQTLKEVNFIEKALELPPSAKILDLCSGHGRHAIELAKRGYSVICQDFNKNLLRISEKLAIKAGVSIATVCQDMRKIPFENELDGIINMWSSFGYLKNKEEDLKVLKQVSRALNSSGKFLTDLDNKEWIFRHFNEKRKYKFEQLKVSGTSQLEIKKGTIKTNLLLQEKDKKPEKIELIMRYYSLEEMKAMLSSVGLQIKKIYGGFEEEEYSDIAPRMIILSQKHTA